MARNTISTWKLMTARLGTCALRRNEEGAAGVEMALTFPLVLSAIFGVIEFGRIALIQSSMNFAAQEATRYAVVQVCAVTAEEMRSFVEDRIFGVDSSLAVITSASVTSGSDVTYTVSLSYAYQPILPIFPGDGYTISAESRGFVASLLGAGTCAGAET